MTEDKKSIDSEAPKPRVDEIFLKLLAPAAV
jgi:hypothetical protein